jgi:2-dehydro-3-deoxyglucarate aldolase/4-hydroxy-2-oxoheptanedioate aldolase
MLTKGDFIPFLTKPIAAVFLLIAVASIVYPMIKTAIQNARPRRRNRKPAARRTSGGEVAAAIRPHHQGELRMIGKNCNPAAEALRAGKKVSAAWLQAGSPVTAEIIAEAGFDVAVIDMEHGPAGDIMTVMSMIQAMKGEPAVPFARAPWNDMVQIKRILDAGIYGLIVPYVCSKAEAEAAVRYAKYPPEGVRGIAGSPRAGHYGNNSAAYFESANKDIFVFVQIEHPTALRTSTRSSPSRAWTASSSARWTWRPPTASSESRHPADPEIIKTLEAKVKASGKALATVCSDWADAKAKYDRGYNMIMMISDTVNLGRLAREEVAKFQKEVAGR